MLKVRRGQSLLEYAILMVIIIAALLTMQTYIKRALQGKLKSSAEEIGDQYSTAKGANYYKKVTTNSRTRENSVGGTTTTKQLCASKTNTITRINTNADGEYWGH